MKRVYVYLCVSVCVCVRKRVKERGEREEKGHCPGRPHKPAGGRERCRDVWSTAFVLS